MGLEPSSGVLDWITPSQANRPGTRASLPDNWPVLPLRENSSQLRNHNQSLIIPSSSSQPKSSYPASNPNPSPGRRHPVSSSPHPDGVRQMDALKRIPNKDYTNQNQIKRHRMLTPSVPVKLDEDDQQLLRLKEEERLPWKDISTQFRDKPGKSYQVAALQMRYRRLRARFPKQAQIQ